MIQVDLQNIRSFIPLPYEAALSPPSAYRP